MFYCLTFSHHCNMFFTEVPHWLGLNASPPAFVHIMFLCSYSLTGRINLYSRLIAKISAQVSKFCTSCGFVISSEAASCMELLPSALSGRPSQLFDADL